MREKGNRIKPWKWLAVENTPWDCLAREENETEEKQDNTLHTKNGQNNGRWKKFTSPVCVCLKQKAVSKHKQDISWQLLSIEIDYIHSSSLLAEFKKNANSLLNCIELWFTFLSTSEEYCIRTNTQEAQMLVSANCNLRLPFKDPSSCLPPPYGVADLEFVSILMSYSDSDSSLFHTDHT